MQKPPHLSDAEATFRRQCEVLGRAHDEQTVTTLLGAFDERFDRALFDQLWRQEEDRVRRRREKAAHCRKWLGVALIALGVLVVILLIVFASKVSRGHVTIVPVEAGSPTDTRRIGPGFLVYMAFVALAVSFMVWVSSPGWEGTRSHLQRGMAHLLLSRQASVEDVGCLVDISGFNISTPEQWKTYTGPAIKRLTALLPIAVQTDALHLNPHQRDALREIIVRFAQYLTGNKPRALLPEHADFAAAVLLTLNALGELRGSSKEIKAAHTAVAKLATAPPRPNEPTNHQYIREIARETLPFLQAGRTTQ